MGKETPTPEMKRDKAREEVLTQSAFAGMFVGMIVGALLGGIFWDLGGVLIGLIVGMLGGAGGGAGLGVIFYMLGRCLKRWDDNFDSRRSDGCE